MGRGGSRRSVPETEGSAPPPPSRQLLAACGLPLAHSMKVASDTIATRGLILRGPVGSTAHGLHLAGTDDRDEMGIAVEPPERVIGLAEFEQHIHRTA